MNYLGHLVLSGQDDEVLLGNFMADAVKGSSYKMYPKGIQKGILLHRKIDDFTDHHESYLNGKRRFYDDYPKMGGVILDIIYDHLLWQYELKHQKLNLKEEIKRYYTTLDAQKTLMPDRVKFMYVYMKRDDWLSNYQHEWGVKRALNGIGRRIGYSNQLEISFSLVSNHRKKFLEEFETFFHDIKKELGYC